MAVHARVIVANDHHAEDMVPVVPGGGQHVIGGPIERETHLPIDLGSRHGALDMTRQTSGSLIFIE